MVLYCQRLTQAASTKATLDGKVILIVDQVTGSIAGRVMSWAYLIELSEPGTMISLASPRDADTFQCRCTDGSINYLNIDDTSTIDQCKWRLSNVELPVWPQLRTIIELIHCPSIDLKESRKIRQHSFILVLKRARHGLKPCQDPI